MADMEYTVRLNGHEVVLVAPENASPMQLRAAAEKAIPSPATPPPASAEPPEVPLSEGLKRPPSIGPADRFGRSASAAFREGFLKPRENDPFGINPENRSFTALDIPYDVARGLLELGESTYGGIKQGTGQLLYNMGASQSSPATIADKAFEPLELASLTAGMNPAGLFRIPASGLSLTSRIPVVGPTLARRSAERAAAARAEQTRRAELQALADRHGVDLLPADVAGPTVRGTTAGARQTSIGGAFIDNTATRANTQMSGATRAVAGRQGNVIAPVDAGEALQRGARTFSTRTSQQGGRMYRQAETEAGNVQIDPSRAVNLIDSEINRLSQSRVPGRAYPEIDELQAYRDRLTRQGGLNFEGMQQILSDAKKAGRTDALRGTDAGRILGDMARLGAEDVDISLTLAGRNRAAQLYRRANAFWRDRVETIDNALEPILGAGKSGEDALAGLVSMAGDKKGGSNRLRRVLSSMPAADANNARATIINRLGAASAGQQNAGRNAFNTSTFLTNWSNMSVEGRRALFGNNPRVAQELDDLARIAEAKKLTASYANTSGTGRAANYAQGLRDTAVLATSGYLGGAAPTLAILALNVGGGALLASPGFARILASAPRTAASVAQRQRILTNLRSLAAREPGLGPYINQVAEKISNPAPPPFDYTKVGGTAPAPPDLSKMSEADVGALRASMLQEEAPDLQPVPMAEEVPPPSMAPSPDLQ